MSLDYDPRLVLRLVGPLRVVRRDGGAEVTPRSAKAQGLLALLGAAPALRRPRPWLQDKLWSDDAEENGSASLRQTVHRLRQALGPERDALITEPGWIGLDPTRVAVVLDPEAGDWEATGEPPEFCEGLDIADSEFEDWIRDQRLAFEDRIGERPAPAHPLRLIMPAQSDAASLFVAAVDVEDRSVAALATMLGTQVGMAVSRIGGAPVRLEANGAEPPPGAIRLTVDGYRYGEKVILQASLGEDDALVWSNSRTFPLGTSGGGCAAFERFVSEVMAAAVHHLGRGGTGEGASQIRAGYRALENLFALGENSLANCERVFAATTEGAAATFHRAWRAQIRVISVIERMAIDQKQASAEALEMISESLAEDPQSSIVNAIAADVALLFEDSPTKAAHYAQRAVESDPFSPYARTSRAQTLAWLGRSAQAHTEALRALRLTAGHPNQSWWLMRCCVTAVRCGRYAEAARHAQLAHELAPSFKPPLRFLAALRFHEGDEKRAADALCRLKVLEPDFSLELMQSRIYPATTIHDTPLIGVTRSGLI